MNESNHPVLTQMNEKIANLEAEVQKWKDEAFKEAQLRREVLVDKLNYQERVKNVLVGALDDNDTDTVEYIARNLDITLTVTKTYEINVTFTVEVELEPNEEIDPDWDFDFSVSHDSIQDYTSDVIWSNVQ